MCFSPSALGKMDSVGADTRRERRIRGDEQDKLVLFRNPLQGDCEIGSRIVILRSCN